MRRQLLRTLEMASEQVKSCDEVIANTPHECGRDAEKQFHLRYEWLGICDHVTRILNLDPNMDA